jgi:1-deoxy-D-xylulose-5-phosphate reductoisomerase
VRRVVILGSTGSIGTQTIDIIKQHPDRLQIVGLAAGRNVEALKRQAEDFPGVKLAVYEPSSEIPSGMQAIIDLATLPEADIVVVSVAGVIGLLPTVEAIKLGKHIALASKEVLVAAGEIVMPMIKQYGSIMTPIDSEHSAIFQCLQGYETTQIDEILLTASGGPFRGKSLSDLAKITPEQALNHPTWSMGGKITVDSATLMNKGLETIEAKWLFGVELDQVKIIVHPQSVIHSMVKFRDGSVLGQLGWPNMRLPIQYALLYPERKPNELPSWSPLDHPVLTFEALDEQTFKCPSLARHSVQVGGTMPCVMNAANEEAANAFLRGETGFLDIPDVVSKTIERHEPVAATLESILETDAWARATARNLIRI